MSSIHIQEANLVGSLRGTVNLKGTIQQTVDLRGSLVLPRIIYSDGWDQTYILVDDFGNEVTAVVSDEPVILDATANDIRLGTAAATSTGYTKGEKIIPSYNTVQGYRVIKSGEQMIVPIYHPLPLYDFTNMQAIICGYNTNVLDSVSAELVSIDNKVYKVKSITDESSVVKDHINQSIDFGLINHSDNSVLIRYFLYKEIV